MWSHQILCSALLSTSLPRLESLFFLVKGFNNNPGLTQPRTSCLCICYFFFTNDFSLPRMDSYCMVEYKVLVNFSFRNSISISTITPFKDTEIYKRAVSPLQSIKRRQRKLVHLENDRPILPGSCIMMLESHCRSMIPESQAFFVVGIFLRHSF